MIPQRREERSVFLKAGASLVIVLVALATLSVLLVSLLVILVPSRASHSAHQRILALSRAAESVEAEALGKLQISTNQEHFLTYSMMLGGEKKFLNSWYDRTEKTWKHEVLTSGENADFNEVGRSGESFTPYLPDPSGIRDEMTIMVGEAEVEVPRMKTRNGMSYGYWIEDLNGKLDYEAVTYQGELVEDSMDPYLTITEELRRSEDRVMDQRHTGLNVFSDGDEGEREASVDFSAPIAARGSGQSGYPHPLERVIPIASYAVAAAVLKNSLPEGYDKLLGEINIGLADTITHEVVPYGRGYPNAGEMKLNLNEALGEDGVRMVAGQIRMVKGFQDSEEDYAAVGVGGENPITTRYGGFPAHTQSYTRTLAANILDYADADSHPRISSNGDALSYRGIDAYPHYTELARRTYISDATPQGVVVQIRNFMELYNPTSQTVKGFLRVKIIPSEDHEITLGGASYPLPPEELFYWDGLITIPPNGYKVVELTQDLDGDYQGDAEAYLHYELPSAGGVNVTASRSSSVGNKIEVWWHAGEGAPTSLEDFVLVDGLVHGAFDVARTSLIDTSNKNANNTLHGLPLYAGMTGDTRNTYYCQKLDIGALNYADRTSFGGANDYQLTQAGKVAPEELFPDRYYSPLWHGKDVRGSASTPSRGMRYPGEFGYVRWDNPEGVKSQNLEDASGNSISQYYEESTAESRKRYVQPISNRGYFTSLGELGNVYDPAQWRHVRRPFTGGQLDPDYFSADFAHDQSGQLMTSSELGEFGGGITLAIGSPEFHCFSHFHRGKGYESARLLDQFRVTESPVRSLQNRVNLNTASRDVLRALFSGFMHTDDPVIGAFVQQPRNETKDVASALADGIIAARSDHPFTSLSDIALAHAPHSGRVVPLFGEKAFYSNADAHVFQEVWSDQGREELFRRMNDLFTYHSRAYRIHYQLEQQRAGRTIKIRKSLDVTLHPFLREDFSVNRSRASRVKIHRRMEY